MKHRAPLDETVCTILGSYHRIAVVGLSDKPWRDSYAVAKYLVDHGYEIIPVNPEIHQVFALRSYPDLLSAPRPVEVVNIFRRTEYIPEIVDQAIQVGAKAVWMQYALVEQASAERARKANLLVVMDRCIRVEHNLHFGKWNNE